MMLLIYMHIDSAPPFVGARFIAPYKVMLSCNPLLLSHARACHI
jgi:hypothetical protein